MKNPNWKDFAELIGIAAIVASLIFVGLQMKQTEEVARYERYGTAINRVDLANLLAENSDVWLEGCAGGDLEHKDWFVFLHLADVIAIGRNARWELNQLIRQDSLAAPDVAVYRQALDLHSNPGLLKAWRARFAVSNQVKEYVHDTGRSKEHFAAKVEEALEALKTNPPAVLSNGPLCGLR